jgi:hypothetical protein
MLRQYLTRQKVNNIKHDFKTITNSTKSKKHNSKQSQVAGADEGSVANFTWQQPHRVRATNCKQDGNNKEN